MKRREQEAWGAYLLGAALVATGGFAYLGWWVSDGWRRRQRFFVQLTPEGWGGYIEDTANWLPDNEIWIKAPEPDGPSHTRAGARAYAVRAILKEGNKPVLVPIPADLALESDDAKQPA